MRLFEPARPTGSTRDWLDALYAGDVFLLEGTAAAKEAASSALEEVEDAFADVGGAAHAHEHLSGEIFFARIKELRRRFFCSPEWHDAVRRLLADAGFDPGHIAFDPLRLRAVSSGGHRNLRAQPVYGTHRDVWYAHRHAMITWWIPLHDADESETFEFYPRAFGREVLNDSEVFDYREWVKDGPDLRIGWQDIEAGRTAVYPAYREGERLQELDARGEQDLLSERRGFSCSAGNELLFAGAHLHATKPHDSGRTRYSFDFRMVLLDDLTAGRGAHVPDDRSRGDATVDYVHPATPSMHDDSGPRLPA